MVLFLSLVVEDIQTYRAELLTIISDRQKGLIEVIRSWLPNAEHKMSARHIYGNLKKKWSGLSMKNLFLVGASTCVESVFDHKMQLLKILDKDVQQWLVDHDPNNWCMDFFEMNRTCASFENGISESYYYAIMFARGKAIIKLFEDIRVYLMHRLVVNGQKPTNLDDAITPSVRKELRF